MITPAHARTMARYNAWQNQSLYRAAADLDEAAREADRGAFFGSIRGTFSHLMWGDLIWMSRFDGGERPEGGISGSAALFDWETLWGERPRLDARIAGWSWMLTEAELGGDLSWHSGALGRDVSRPMALCVAHFFNHQTHHRGQVHAMLTAAGAAPGDTDLFMLPEDVPEWH
jgi:uncharacterized damage-inducible protein DinB